MLYSRASISLMPTSQITYTYKVPRVCLVLREYHIFCQVNNIPLPFALRNYNSAAFRSNQRYCEAGQAGYVYISFLHKFYSTSSNSFSQIKFLRCKLKKLSFIPMKFRWPSGKEPSLRDEFCLSNHAGAFSNPISNVEKPLEKRKQSLDKN